jgi:hypothetical protein
MREGDLQKQLPISHVNPLPKLPADLSKMGYLFKAEFFVNSDARVVRECNASHHDVHLALAQLGE